MDIMKLNKLIVSGELSGRELEIAKFADENYQDASCFLAQLNNAEEEIKKLKENKND
jgi:hypothetical protein